MILLRALCIVIVICAISQNSTGRSLERTKRETELETEQDTEPSTSDNDRRYLSTKQDNHYDLKVEKTQDYSAHYEDDDDTSYEDISANNDDMNELLRKIQSNMAFNKDNDFSNSNGMQSSNLQAMLQAMMNQNAGKLDEQTLNQLMSMIGEVLRNGGGGQTLFQQPAGYNVGNFQPNIAGSNGNTVNINELLSMIMSGNQKGGMIMNDGGSPSQLDRYNSKLDMAELQNMFKEKGYDANPNSAIENEQSQLQELQKIIMLNGQPNGGNANLRWRDLDHQMTGQDVKTGTENMDMRQLMKLISSISIENGNSQLNINPDILKMLMKMSSSNPNSPSGKINGHEINLNPDMLKYLMQMIKNRPEDTGNDNPNEMNKILQLMQGQSQFNEPMYPVDGSASSNQSPDYLLKLMKMAGKNGDLNMNSIWKQIQKLGTGNNDASTGYNWPGINTDENPAPEYSLENTVEIPFMPQYPHETTTKRPGLSKIFFGVNKPKDMYIPSKYTTRNTKVRKPYMSFNPQEKTTIRPSLSKIFFDLFKPKNKDVPWNYPTNGRNPYMPFQQHKSTTKRPSLSKMFFDLFTPKDKGDDNNWLKTESSERPYDTRPHNFVESTTRPSLMKIFSNIFNPKDRPNEQDANLPVTQSDNGWYHKESKDRPNAPKKPDLFNKVIFLKPDENKNHYNRPGHGRNGRPKYNLNNGLQYNPNNGPGYNPNNSPGYILNNNPSDSTDYHFNNGSGYIPNNGPGYNPNNGPRYNPNNGPGYIINNGKRYRTNHRPELKHPFVVETNYGENIIINPQHEIQLNRTVPSVSLPHRPLILFKPPSKRPRSTSILNRVLQYVIDKNKYEIIDGTSTKQPIIMPLEINEPETDSLKKIIISPYPSVDPSKRPADVNVYFPHDDDQLIVPPYDTHAIDEKGRPVSPEWQPLIDKAVHLAHHLFPNQVADVHFMPDSSSIKPISPHWPSLIDKAGDLVRQFFPKQVTDVMFMPELDNPDSGNLLSIPEMIKSFISGNPSNPYKPILPTTDRPKYRGERLSLPRLPSYLKLIVPKIPNKNGPSLLNTLMNLLRSESPIDDSLNDTPYLLEPWTPPHNKPKHVSLLDNILSLLNSNIPTEDGNEYSVFPEDSEEDPLWPSTSRKPPILTQILTLFKASDILWHPLQNTNKNLMDYLQPLLESSMLPSDRNEHPFYNESPENNPSDNPPIYKLVNRNNRRPSLSQSILEPLLRSGDPNAPFGSSPFRELFNPNRKRPSLLELILGPLLRSSDPYYPSDNSPIYKLVNRNNRRPSLSQSILEPLLRSGDPNAPFGSSPFRELFNPNRKIPSLLELILGPLLRSSDPYYPPDNSPLDILFNPNNRRPSLLESIINPLLRSSDPYYPSDNSPLNLHINPNNRRPSLLESIINPLLRSSDPYYPSDNSPLNLHINPNNRRPSLLESIINPLLRSSDPYYPSDNSPLDIHINPNSRRPSLLESIINPLLRSSDPYYPSDNSPLDIHINPNNRRPSLLQSILDPFLRSSDPNYPSDNSPMNILINPYNRRPSLLQSILDPFLRSSDPNYPSDNSPSNKLINPNNRRPSLLQSILNPFLRSSDPNYPSDSLSDWPDLWHLIPQLDKDPKDKHKSILAYLLRVLQSVFEPLDGEEILNVIKNSESPMAILDILWPKRLPSKLLPDTILPTWDRFVQLTNFAPTALTGILSMLSSESSSTDPWDDTTDKIIFGDKIPEDRSSLSHFLTSSLLHDDSSYYPGKIPGSTTRPSLTREILSLLGSNPSNDLLTSIVPELKPGTTIKPSLTREILSLLGSNPSNDLLTSIVPELGIKEDPMRIPINGISNPRKDLSKQRHPILDLLIPEPKDKITKRILNLFKSSDPGYPSVQAGRPDDPSDIFNGLRDKPNPLFGPNIPTTNSVRYPLLPKRDLDLSTNVGRPSLIRQILSMLHSDPKPGTLLDRMFPSNQGPGYLPTDRSRPSLTDAILSLLGFNPNRNGPSDLVDKLVAELIPGTRPLLRPHPLGSHPNDILPLVDPLNPSTGNNERPSTPSDILTNLILGPKRENPYNPDDSFKYPSTTARSLLREILKVLDSSQILPNDLFPLNDRNYPTSEPNLEGILGVPNKRPSTISNIFTGLNAYLNQGNPLNPIPDFPGLLQLLKRKIADNPYGQISLEKLSEICNMLLKRNVKPSVITELLGQPDNPLQRLRNLLQPLLSPTTKKYYPSIFPSPSELVASATGGIDKLFTDLLKSEPEDDLFPSLSGNSKSPFTELKNFFKFYFGEPEQSSSLSETVRQFLTKLTTDPRSLRDDVDIKRDDRLINLIQKISTMNEPDRKRIYDCLRLKSILPTLVAAEDEGINCDLIKLLVKLKFPQLSESQINDMIAQQVSSLMQNGRRQSTAYDHWSMLTKPEDLSMEYKDAIVE